MIKIKKVFRAAGSSQNMVKMKQKIFPHPLSAMNYQMQWNFLLSFHYDRVQLKNGYEKDLFNLKTWLGLVLWTLFGLKTWLGPVLVSSYGPAALLLSISIAKH